MIAKFAKHLFLFEELVKRDFKQKYKGTVIGMAWSVLSPLLNLLVLRLVFTQFFGRNTPHYTTYLFAGNLIFSFFSESTKGGMSSVLSNASIFSKINVPKYLFLLSKNVSTLINFGLTLCVFFLFCALIFTPPRAITTTRPTSVRRCARLRCYCAAATIAKPPGSRSMPGVSG